MDTHHEHHRTFLQELEHQLYQFYKRENHTVGNYLFLYWVIAIGLLGVLFLAEITMLK